MDYSGVSMIYGGPRLPLSPVIEWLCGQAGTYLRELGCGRTRMLRCVPDSLPYFPPVWNAKQGNESYDYTFLGSPPCFGGNRSPYHCPMFSVSKRMAWNVSKDLCRDAANPQSYKVCFGNPGYISTSRPNTTTFFTARWKTQNYGSFKTTICIQGL